MHCMVTTQHQGHHNNNDLNKSSSISYCWQCFTLPLNSFADVEALKWYTGVWMDIPKRHVWVLKQMQILHGKVLSWSIANIIWVNLIVLQDDSFKYLHVKKPKNYLVPVCNNDAMTFKFH